MRALDRLVRHAVAEAGLDCRDYRTIELVRREPSADGRVLLVFLDAAAEPALFLKLGSGARAESLETEFANLERLHELGNDGLRACLTRPLLLDRHDDFRVLVTDAFGGSRMKDLPPAAYFASAAFERQLQALLDWWLEFRACFEAVELGAPPDAAGEIALFRKHYRRTAALDALLDESAAALDGMALPLCPSHGDLCTANVLVDDADRLRVIDWEAPIARAWPLADMLYFFSSIWAVDYGRGAIVREANFRALFFESTPRGDRWIARLDRLAQRLGLERGAILPLSVLSWVGHANRKHAALGVAGEIPDALATRHFPLVVVREGHCRNLELLASLKDDYRPGSIARAAE